MIHFLGTLTLMEIALTALAVLSTLWLATTPLVLSRIRRRRTLRVADDLYAELVGQLDRLETRIRVNRVQIRPPVGPTIHNASPGFEPDLPEDLDAQRISKLRTRAEGVLRGLRFQGGATLDSSCRALEAIDREVRALVDRVDGRSEPEAAQAEPAAPQPVSQPSALAVLEVA